MEHGFIPSDEAFDEISAAVRAFKARGRRRHRNRKRDRGGGGGVREQPMLVKSVEIDHLTCHKFDFITEGTEDILVALPYLLRRTPFDGVTIDAITFTYASNIERSLTDGSTTEVQVITPRYRGEIGSYVGDVIFVKSGILKGTGVTVATVPLKFLDGNDDGREWARKKE